MANTFYNCYGTNGLKNGLNIGTGVTNMYRTFYNCKNMRGNIMVYSNGVTNAA